jgi:hypothetical protein
MNLLRRSARNVGLVILIVERSAGFFEWKALGVLFTTPLNDDAAVQKPCRSSPI